MEFNELKELGLTEGEIKVYLALLKLNTSTKRNIAKEAEVSESKVYEIIDRLMKKGLVTSIKKRRGEKEISHFNAVNPILLKDFLRKKREEIDKEEKILDNLLPNLQARLKSSEKEYGAVVYEGYKGIQASLRETLKIINKSDDWIGMGVRSDKPKQYNLLWVNFLRERAKKGGKGRILFVDKGTEYYNQLKRLPNTEVRYLKGISPSAITVTKNRVMIFNYTDEPSCLTITNKEIADSFKSFFESLWNLGKKD